MLVVSKKQLLQDFVNKAFQTASSESVLLSMNEEGIHGLQKQNKYLSKLWVKSLAEEFRQHYKIDDNYRVFSRDYAGNKKEFKINEYLYDIAVIRTMDVKSIRGKSLECPHETVWLVESEFHATDSRASIIDFGKLVIGSAKNKVLILPSGGSIESWALKRLAITPMVAEGNWYLCFLPHPREWVGISSNDVRPRVYELSAKK